MSAKIVIILDNASFHKRKDILEKIETEMPNFILEFLPPYSPDYNLIELVWHSAKEYIAHRLFESVEQLEELLHKLLNQGGLIIKWDRKIKNKGNAIVFNLAATQLNKGWLGFLMPMYLDTSKQLTFILKINYLYF